MGSSYLRHYQEHQYSSNYVEFVAQRYAALVENLLSRPTNVTPLNDVAIDADGGIVDHKGAAAAATIRNLTAADYFNDPVAHRYQHEGGGPVAEKSLNLHVLSLAVNPSSFGAFNTARQLTLKFGDLLKLCVPTGVETRQPGLGGQRADFSPLAAGIDGKEDGGIGEETVCVLDDTIPSGHDIPAARQTYRMVSIGMHCLRTLLGEISDKSPTFCSAALNSLQHLLGALPPEALALEPKDFVVGLYQLLADLRSSPCEDVATASSSCMLALTIAYGVPELLLDTASLYLTTVLSTTDERKRLLRDRVYIRVPENFYALHQLAFRQIAGFYYADADWTRWPLTESNILCSFTVSSSSKQPTSTSSSHLDDVKPKYASLANDGRFVYVLTGDGLSKFGTGCGETILGALYARNPQLKATSDSWLASCNNVLYLRRQHSTKVFVLDNETLLDVGEILLTPQVAQGLLCSDGSTFYLLIVQESSKTLTLTALNDCFATLDDDQLRFPITESKLLFLGDHHAWINGADVTSKFDSQSDEILYIKVMKEAALLLDKSGRVFSGTRSVVGRGVQEGDPTMMTSPLRWMELGLSESVVNVVPSADGLSALLLCSNGQAYFASSGCLKRPTGISRTQTADRSKGSAQRPQRVSAPNNRRIIGGACSDGTVVLLTENGRLFVAGVGKQAPYSNPDTGQILGLEHIHVAQVAMGKTHTVAVTRHGHVYTFGANHLGQCGRAELATFRPTATGDSDSDRSKTDDDLCGRGESGAASIAAVVGWAAGYSTSPARLCAPNDHIWLRETATICTACGFCSARGYVCPNSKDKQKGAACGCGPGLSGCVKCGVCRTCGKQYHRASGSERDSEGESAGAPPYPQLMPARLTLRPVGDCRAAEVSCGNYHSIVRTTDGHVVTFGSNRHGQLGVGDVKSRLGPQFVLLPTSVVAAQVAAGANHCVVRTTEGLVYTFGKHHNGQLGRDGRASSAWFAAPGLVEGFGADSRKTATWIGAGCDVTLIIYEQNLFTVSTLNTACVTANQFGFAIFPKPSKKDRGNYFILKRTSSPSKVVKLRTEGPDGVGKCNSVWSMDPLYNVFWNYCPDTGRVCCHAPTATVNFSHPLSYLQNLEYWIPLKHQPVVESQVGLSLLACYYSLISSKFRLFNFSSVTAISTEQENGDQLTADFKDGCSEVCRFQSFGGGWGYSLQSVEAIQFSASKDVWILGMGLFGGRGEYLARIKLLKMVSSSGDEERAVETIAESDEILYECSPKEKCQLYFGKPVMCRAGQWHVAWTSINGPSSDCGAGGMASVRTEDGITFYFRSSRLSNNGTDVHVGQIPSILYSTAQLPQCDKQPNDSTSLSSSSNFAALIEKPLSTRFYLTLPPRYFSILTGLLSSASKILFSSSPSAPSSSQHLHSSAKSCVSLSDCQIREWECEQAAATMVFGVRMLGVAMGLVYPRNRPSSAVEREDFASAMCECGELILRTLNNELTEECNTVKRLVLVECRELLLNFFHLFFPTPSSICCQTQTLMKSPAQGVWMVSTFLTAVSRLGTPVTCLFAQNCPDSPPVPYPALAGQLQKRKKNKCKAHLEFLSFSSFLVDLIFDSKAAQDKADQLQASVAAVELLVRVIADLVKVIGNENGDASGAITSSNLPTLFQSPKRFGRMSSTASWDTGGGSPDAIAFQVDRGGVSIHGAGVYTGFGNFTYSLELLVNQGDHIAEKWLTLEKSSGAIDARNCANDIAYVKFHKPVKLEAHCMYAFRLRMNGGRTWNGECGVASVSGYKGVRFTFYPCTQSLNGTSVNRGQLPVILFSLETNSHASSCIESSTSIRWILALTKSLVARLESTLQTLSLEKGAPESNEDEEGKRTILERMKNLVPRFFGYLSILVERNPLITFDVASSLDELLMTIFSINSRKRKGKRMEADAVEDESPAQASTPIQAAPRVERIAMESDHPYKPCKVYSYIARFDLDVAYMTLEFDANCCTAQPEDSLQLYLTAFDGQFYPVAKIFGGPRNWPKSLLLLPGNCVWFILESASNYTKDSNSSTSMYGFKCLVTGYANVDDDCLLLLEAEVVNLCAYCCRQIIEKNYQFSQVQNVSILQDSVDVKILEEETDDMVRDHLTLLRKGLYLEHTPNVHELIAGKLPLKRASPELRFLRDFINATATSAGGKLSRWLMPEAYVDPFHCEVSLDLENLRSGQAALVTILSKDQYGRIAYASNATVEVFVGSVSAQENGQEQNEGASEEPTAGRNGNANVDEVVEVSYQPTYLNKARYISVTLMKQAQKWSFEELRLMHFRESISKESLHVVSSRDGTYTATWTPKQSGYYRVECRIDGISISQIHNVEVLNGQIVNRKRSRRTAYLSRARMATVYKDDTQGVRIRSAPSLQAPQTGLLPAGSTVLYVDECENGDGVWLRLNDESAVMFCTKLSNPLQAWCLQYHAHLKKTLIYRDSDATSTTVGNTTADATMPMQSTQSVVVACEDEYAVRKLETAKGNPIRVQQQIDAKAIAFVGMNDVVQSKGWVQNADGEIWIHVVADIKNAAGMKNWNAVEGYCLVQEPGGAVYFECCVSRPASRTNSVNAMQHQSARDWDRGNMTNGNASSVRQSSTQTSPGDKQRKFSMGDKSGAVAKQKPVVKVAPQNASVVVNQQKRPVVSAMSPSIADSIRSVFAALLWHEQLVHDAMACSAYLKFHPALQRTLVRQDSGQANGADGSSPAGSVDGFQSNIPIGLQMLQSLWKQVFVAVQTIIEKHWILPSPPMAVKTPDQRPFGTALPPFRHHSQQDSISQQLQFCELCEGWFPQTVTLHMRSAHPGCGSHAGGQGYNSLGRYTGGWTGNCGDGGQGSSPWYLLCYRCRANYLQTTDTQRQRQRRDKARLFRISTGNVEPQRILKNNAMFLLELNMRDDDESLSSKAGVSADENEGVSGGGGSPVKGKSTRPTQAARQTDWVVNLFPRQIGASSSSEESNELGRLRSRESTHNGPLKDALMETAVPVLDGHTFASDPGPKLLRTDDELSLPSSEPSSGQQQPAVARRVRTSSIMVLGSSDFQCLASPSHALQAAVRMDSASASVQSTLRRPTIAFVIQHHDLSHVRRAMLLAVIRTVLLEYSFQVFVWLLRNGTNPSTVVDVLLHFVTAMTNLKPTPAQPQSNSNADRTLPHPLKLTLLAGSIRQGVVRQFHIFLHSIAGVLRHHERVSFDALRACLRSFMFQFTTHDQDLILKSKILSTLSSIMSDRRDDSSSMAGFFHHGARSSSSSLAELEELVDLSHLLTVDAGSRRAMVPSLLDGTTETFWESGEEEKGKTKLLTVRWPSDHNSLPVLLSIYIDNCQDVRHRTSQVCFTAIVNGEPRKRLKAQTLETQFVGWVKCYVALCGAVCVELKSPDPYVRLRQISLTGVVRKELTENRDGPAMMKHSPSIIMQFDAVQTDAFDLFQLLASNAFGDCVGGAVNAAGTGHTSNLQQQVLYILFSRNQMNALQNYVSSQMVNALDREILLLRDKLKRNYSYCCGLMTMLSRVISSPHGRQSVLSKAALLSSVSELPLFSSPVVQCQALETVEKLLSVFEPRRTNAESLVENLIILIAKALTLQIRQRPSQISKTVTAPSILLDEGRLLKWHAYRSTSPEIAQFATKLLTEMAFGEKFGSAWSMTVKTTVANEIALLALLPSELRDWSLAVKEGPFWLAAGALCICQHQDWLQFSPAWRSLVTKASVEATLCENHDDGRTMAVIYCEQCKLYMCSDCSSVLHLNRKSRTHVMQHLTTADAQMQVIVHETCSRLKTNWLLLSVDRSTMNGMAEFRPIDGLMRASSSQHRSTPGLPSGKRCRFCDAPTLSELHEACTREDCQNLLAMACHRTLACGHACGGVANETECPPCLRCHDASLKQDSDDMCVICFTETLSAAPIVLLSCGHVFHYHCCRATLTRRWPGPRITFGFMCCPICKAPMDHPALRDTLDALIELREEVKRKATVRLEYDGLAQCSQLVSPGGPYFNDPAAFAMDRYAYYLCHQCQKPYFGGEAQCQQLNGSNDYNPSELVCGGCSDVARAQICPRHGLTYLEYKCRYCCSIAVFFCFGTTHFCAACHDDFQRLIALPVDQLPSCPAGPRATPLDPNEPCPLKVTHPPTGEEFALGCGICRNLSTF